MKDNTVIIERLLDAPATLVWSIWTKPEYIMHWFGSDMNGTVLSADVDLSVGGQYRISFRDSDGSMHKAFGEYIEVTAFKKLRYSFEWVSEPGFVTDVVVELMPQADKTLLKLTHSNLNPNSLHGYLDGWNGAINKIVKKIIEKQLFF